MAESRDPTRRVRASVEALGFVVVTVGAGLAGVSTPVGVGLVGLATLAIVATELIVAVWIARKGTRP